MNILLIVADALRADHLSCYGYPRYTTPFIDRLAETGCLFSQTFSVSNSTDPCFTSLLTGRHPITHGITAMYGPERKERQLAESLPVLAELLQEKGYATAAVDTLQKWFKRGFEDYLLPGHGEKPVPLAGVVFEGDAITERALEWAEKFPGGRPYFLFLHYWDTHAPYTPPTRFSRLFEDDALWREPLPRKVFLDIIRQAPFTAAEMRLQKANYDRELAYMDTELERLFARLAEKGLMEDTLVVFTSDHGESLWEHDIMLIHYGLYDPAISIPLIIRAPGKLPEGKRVSGLASQVDIMPTILELAGIDAPEGLEGKSLVGAACPGRTEREAIWLEEGSHQRTRGLRTKDWKLIKSIKPTLTCAPPRELYDLRRDPQELHNLWETRPRQAKSLETQLRQWVNAHGGDYDQEEEQPWRCLFGPYRDKTL
jgi:arylsulfatase A-like enzyme